MIDVVMPQMGESIVEGTLTKWLKKIGDRVERDEALFEISTDKVDTEIPAPAAGTLAATLVEEGKTVSINTVVARIDEAGGSASASIPAPSKAAAQPQPAPTMQGSEPEPEPAAARLRPSCAGVAAAPEPAAAAAEEPAGPLSPLVRRLARENNIDLRQVNGTGAGGRITKQDVESYLAQRERTTRGSAGRRSAARPRPPHPHPAGSRCSRAARAAAARRSRQDARRADEHHAQQDRRAHGRLRCAPRRTSPPSTRST